MPLAGMCTRKGRVEEDAAEVLLNKAALVLLYRMGNFFVKRDRNYKWTFINCKSAPFLCCPIRSDKLNLKLGVFS